MRNNHYSYEINNEILYFDLLCYIDKNGSDETGDGTKDNPYYSWYYCVCQLPENFLDLHIGFVFGEGRYGILSNETGGRSWVYNHHGFSDAEYAMGNFNVKFTLIGQKEKTTLFIGPSDDEGTQYTSARNLLHGDCGVKDGYWKLYDFIFDADASKTINTTYFSLNISASTYFNNIVYIDTRNKFSSWAGKFSRARVGNLPLDENGVVQGYHFPIVFNHCVFMFNGGYSGSNLVADAGTGNTPTTYGPAYFLNSYRFSAYYSYWRKMHYYDGSVISTIRHEMLPDYHIPPEEERPWRHIGVDQNPDGKRSHAGVWGGPFAWGDWTQGDPSAEGTEIIPKIKLTQIESYDNPTDNYESLEKKINELDVLTLSDIALNLTDYPAITNIQEFVDYVNASGLLD